MLQLLAYCQYYRNRGFMVQQGDMLGYSAQTRPRTPEKHASLLRSLIVFAFCWQLEPEDSSPGQVVSGGGILLNFLAAYC